MYPQLRKLSSVLMGVSKPNRHMEDRIGGSNIIPWPVTSDGKAANANKAEKITKYCISAKLMD